MFAVTGAANVKLWRIACAASIAARRIKRIRLIASTAKSISADPPMYSARPQIDTERFDGRGEGVPLLHSTPGLNLTAFNYIPQLVEILVPDPTTNASGSWEQDDHV